MVIDYSSEEFINIIRFWGYPAMFFLMVLEGPIATLASAFLSSKGFFNPLVVFFLSVFGDMVSDVFLYYIGYFGGKRVLLWTEKKLRMKNLAAEKIKEHFLKSGKKIIFYAKTTIGLGAIIFTLAGATRMNFKKFIKFSLLGGLIWSAFLVVLGYFSGYAIEQINKNLKTTGYLILIGAIAVLFLANLSRKRQVRKFLGNLKNHNPPLF